jgi:hypothetical protein
VAQPAGHVSFEPTKLSHTVLLAHKADTKQSKQSNLGRQNASRHEHSFSVYNYMIWALLLRGVFIASMVHTRALAFSIGLGFAYRRRYWFPTLKRTYAMTPEDFALRTEIFVLTEPFAGEWHGLQFIILDMMEEDGTLFQSV